MKNNVKDKKNILIIAYAYPPNNVAGAQRPYALAKHLDKDKYSIKVITCENPDLPIGKNENFDPNIDGVELLFIKSKLGNSENKFRQQTHQKINKVTVISKLKYYLFKIGQQFIFPDKSIFWYPNVKAYLKQNKELIENANVVFSTSPGVTNHWLASFIKKKNRNIKWIADFRDFNYVENWENKTGIKAYLHKKLELSIVEKASNLTFVTKTMQLAYQKFYPKFQNKMHCVYNGFDKGDFSAVITPLTTKLSFFYAGSFYNGLRSPFSLMQLLDKAIEDNLLKPEEIQIQIAGNIEDDIKSAMKDYRCHHRVVFLGSLPRTEVLLYMSKTTFLWLIVANIKSHYQTIPIKLFEYIAAKRPIVNFAPIESESSQIVQIKNLGCNFNTLHFDLDESYQVFKDLLLQYKNGKYNEPMPNENLDSFTWENQMRLIENLLQEI
jgi:glycosyltransferase involved in cell wall biosynthesis